jgi:TRAP-type C4-dicarboxylate transport system permease small subunit
MEKLKLFYDWMYKITMFICKVLLVADILVVCFTVLGRYVSFIPDPTWTEEITLTLMSYMAVLSGALAIRRGAHIRMTSFDRYLPKKMINVLDILADVAILALAYVMIVEGFKYADGIGGKGFYPSLPWLSKKVMYMPIPVAGIAMVIFELESLVNNIRRLMGKKVYVEKEASLEEQVAEGGV